MTTYEKNVHDRAAKKIQRIIAREGTADGQRLQPWYLAEIEDEIRMSDKASALTLLESPMLIGELAKVLKQNGVDMGEKRLFEWMRGHGR